MKFPWNFHDISNHSRDLWAAQLQVVHFAAQGLDFRVRFAQQQRTLLGRFLANDGHGLASAVAEAFAF